MTEVGAVDVVPSTKYSIVFLGEEETLKGVLYSCNIPFNMCIHSFKLQDVLKNFILTDGQVRSFVFC